MYAAKNTALNTAKKAPAGILCLTVKSEKLTRT